MGRLGFPLRALPVLCPVDRVVDGDRIVLRRHTGSQLLDHTRTGEVVVCEADHLEAHTRIGWSVTVTGPVTPITVR